MRILKVNSLPSVREAPWLDRDYIMLHACFQLFVDCVEKEDLFESWSHEDYEDVVEELKELYSWWKNYTLHKEPFNEEEYVQEKLERLIKLRSYLWS